MKELLEVIVKKIVDEPDKVTIEESEDEIGKVLIVNTAEEDKAIVIGKSGRNIRAIRTISSIFAKREGEKVFVKIAE